LRFSIVGSLLAAPPKAGEFDAIWRALAAKTWRHPITGLDVRFGASTIQRWFYKARKAHDPVATVNGG
jgi:putative transposase